MSGKRYRLDFEYLSPWESGKWLKASKESDDLPSLEDQLQGQLTMPDVRNSVISVQEVSDWNPLYDKPPEKPVPPPVDRSQQCLTDGSPVTPDHRELKSNGQQKGYVVLTEEERKKGFVRPVRRSYIHKVCGTTTAMGRALAETYARDPGFYNGTFCCACQKHFPLDQFVWAGTTEQIGS